MDKRESNGFALWGEWEEGVRVGVVVTKAKDSDGEYNYTTTMYSTMPGYFPRTGNTRLHDDVGHLRS